MSEELGGRSLRYCRRESGQLDEKYYFENASLKCFVREVSKNNCSNDLIISSILANDFLI